MEAVVEDEGFGEEELKNTEVKLQPINGVSLQNTSSRTHVKENVVWET